MLLRLETFEGAILAAQKVQLFLAVRFLQEEEFVPTSVFSCFYVFSCFVCFIYVCLFFCPFVFDLSLAR